MFDEYDKYLEGASAIVKDLPDVDEWIDKLTVNFVGSADIDPLDAEMSGYIKEYITKRKSTAAELFCESWSIAVRQHLIMGAQRNAISDAYDI